MPDPTYIATALTVAVTITVALRALPFALKNAVAGSALLADVGRWMPLGAITVLAVYCLAQIALTTPTLACPNWPASPSPSSCTGFVATSCSASSPVPRPA